MERAGVRREGPTGEKRMFHSSLKVTTAVYGRWERAEQRKRQAELLAEAFGV